MQTAVPVFDTITAAFKRVFGDLGQLLKVTLVPIVIVVVLNVIATIVGTASGSRILPLILQFIETLVTLFFMLTWHRAVLLGIDTVGGKTDFSWNPRSQKFILYYIGLAVLFGIAIGIAVVVGAAVGGGLGTILGIVIGLGALFVFVRVQLIFPAIAADHPSTLQTAWNQSAGIFWRMIAINVLIFLAMVISIVTLTLVLTLILGGLALALGTFGAIVGAIIMAVILVPLQWAFIATFVAALSYIYRYVTEHPNPLDA